jgi:hypothetical protein
VFVCDDEDFGGSGGLIDPDLAEELAFGWGVREVSSA